MLRAVWGPSDAPAWVHDLLPASKIARELAIACVRPLLPRDVRSDCVALALRLSEDTQALASFQFVTPWRSKTHRVDRSSCATRRSFEDAKHCTTESSRPSLLPNRVPDRPSCPPLDPPRVGRPLKIGARVSEAPGRWLASCQARSSALSRPVGARQLTSRVHPIQDTAWSPPLWPSTFTGSTGFWPTRPWLLPKYRKLCRPRWGRSLVRCGKPESEPNEPPSAVAHATCLRRAQPGSRPPTVPARVEAKRRALTRASTVPPPVPATASADLSRSKACELHAANSGPTGSATRAANTKATTFPPTPAIMASRPIGW